MYKPELLPTDTMQWAMRNALNELNAFLCEGDPYKQKGKEWPEDAHAISAHCRNVAAAATGEGEKQEWLDLAAQYEDTI